jgi:hypothetical protein
LGLPVSSFDARAYYLRTGVDNKVEIRGSATLRTTTANSVKYASDKRKHKRKDTSERRVGFNLVQDLIKLTDVAYYLFPGTRHSMILSGESDYIIRPMNGKSATH